MNPILVMLPYCKDNAPQAERLIDGIYHLEGKQKQTHHIVIAHHADVHEEMRQRIKMSAEIAFAGVEVLEIRKLSGERPFKFQEIYSAFMQCAQSLNQFIWPWLYLEPDCSPLKTGWLDTLATAYFNQPRRYLGLELKAMAPDGKSVTHNFISRTAIYPANAVLDLVSPSEQQNLPEHRFSHVILPKASTTKLIQQARITTADDLAKLRPDAVLVHGDKNGLALEQALQMVKPEINGTLHIKRRGRPPKVADLTIPEATVTGNQL